MKRVGNCITGDQVSVESYTIDWYSVRIHPTTYYRRIDQFYDGFKSVKGLYTSLDLGQYVMVRFSEKEDVTAFHRKHHEYL